MAEGQADRVVDRVVSIYEQPPARLETILRNPKMVSPKNVSALDLLLLILFSKST